MIGVWQMKRFVILGAVLIVLVLGVGSGPSAADHQQPGNTCLPYPWESEQQLMFLPPVSPNGKDCWRPVVWPGAGHLLTRQQLYEFEDFYADEGYDRNFLWYAPQETVRVADYANRLWTGCNQIPTGVRELCSDVNQSLIGPAFNTTTADPRLTVLKWGNDWISMVCGNNLVRVEDDTPVPSIPIDKFIDENRNGVIDDGDITTGPEVDGVQFEIWRVSSPSWVDQALGHITTVSTNGNGDAEFHLDDHGPGTYEIREIVPSGSITTTPSVRSVGVDTGIGAKRFPVQRFGNAPGTVDVEKVEFEVSDGPDSIAARTDTPITVGVTIRNNGPADDVPVRDLINASSPNEDCIILNPDRTITRTLKRGESYSESFVFIVNCDLPSNHSFDFHDQLDVTDNRLTETDLSNNTASTTHDAPVIAETDLSLGSGIDCPDRTDVDIDTACEVTLDLANDGFGPIEARVDWSVSGLDDCTISPADSSQVVEIDNGDTITLVADHVVNCVDRSFHPFTVNATVTPVDPHVHDTEAANDSTSGSDTLEVFEEADMAVIELDLWLSCDEYFAGDPFTCNASVPITNHGPAPGVIMLTTAGLTGVGCTASPNPQSQIQTVAVGQTLELDFTWSVTCDDPTVVHVLYLDACVEADPSDPHAEDLDPTNDCGRVAAVPIDFKPLSDPNTVNLGRGGLTSVAVLSSPTFNPIAEVDTARPITFGPTGTEATATRCSSEGEDANNDGYDQDLTCKFRNQDLGLTTGDERVYLIGYLTDGTRFIGTEQVRVI